MSRTIDAVFENGVFKPKAPVDLDEKTEVRLIVHDLKAAENAVDLMKAWMEGDEHEQKETWQYLERVLDEDRPSSRQLFEN